MSYPLKRKFKGKEAYVVGLVGQMGVESVMRLYGLKHRKTFLRWFAENSNNKYPKNPFENLSGPEKHKWCKEHLDTIIDCIEIFGEDWVKSNFHFSHDTLYRLIRYGQQDKRGIFIHKELEGMHNHLERIKFMCQAEHLDYVDSIERMRQLEIAVVRFAQMIAHQLASSLTPAMEEVFKVKPGQLKGGQELELNLVESETTPKSHQSDIDGLIAQSAKLVEEQSAEDNPLAETIKRVAKARASD